MKTVILHPGDLLYFPSEWYHEVHNLDSEVYAISGGCFNPLYLPRMNLLSYSAEQLASIKLMLTKLITGNELNKNYEKIKLPTLAYAYKTIIAGMHNFADSYE